MLVGRLGLEKARIPHADRHGLVWLDRGRLEVEDGCLRFVTAGGGDLAAGDYQIPHQAISIILLGPGSSVTHDALRLLASLLLFTSLSLAIAGARRAATPGYRRLFIVVDQSSSMTARDQAVADRELASRIFVARRLATVALRAAPAWISGFRA